MVVHPEAMQKARAKLDAVVGLGRLPGFDDRPHLPYIDALVKEVFRWYLVVPIGDSFIISP